MRFTARSTKPKSGVVAPLQRLMYLWRAYEGPERFDCLSIGTVARWGQIRPQNALSLPQSPFDYKVALHRSRTLAISVSSLRFYFTECHPFWLWSGVPRVARCDGERGTAVHALGFGDSTACRQASLKWRMCWSLRKSMRPVTAKKQPQKGRRQQG